MAAELRTTPELLFRWKTEYFDLLASGAFPELSKQKRRRYIKSLFGLGAICSLDTAIAISSRYACPFVGLRCASPAYRNLALTQPDELSFLLRQPFRPRLWPTELAVWNSLAQGSACARTTWLAQLWTRPWGSAFLLDPRNTQKRLLELILVCRCAGIPDAVALRIAFLASLVQSPTW